MSVTYLLPDAIFQFMGVHASATAQVGRHEAEKMTGAVAAGTAVTRYAMPTMKGKEGNPVAKSLEGGVRIKPGVIGVER